MSYAERLSELTRYYNGTIRELERQYEAEVVGRSRSGRRSLKREYSERYEHLIRNYRAQCRTMLSDEQQAHPGWARGRKIWGWLFFVGVTLLMGFCSSTMTEEEDGQPVSALSSSNTEQRYWNAETIPIPYLQDATQHVSNPDGVLSQQAVDRMNVTLKLMEDSLNVQTIVIAVNCIENDDPNRFALDVGNRYGVGRGDRGLMVVLGYEDHSLNISPGRALEGDLTDVECYRLQQQYAVPAMKAQMPDSGMIYLVDALYATLKHKELPQMSTLLSGEDDDMDDLKNFGIFMLAFVAFITLYSRLNRKYQWVGMVGGATLLANPFAEKSGGGGGGFFFGGGGGGGGFSGGGGGGSFGGGSFGGGGATSRW